MSSNYTLVYCGDDVHTLQLLREGLSDEPYELITLPTLEVLCAELERGLVPSLLLLDTTCPHISLHYLPERIPELSTRQALVLAALVTSAEELDPQAIAAYNAWGVQEIIGKPLRLSALQTAMRAWCSRLHTSNQ